MADNSDGFRASVRPHCDVCLCILVRLAVSGANRSALVYDLFVGSAWNQADRSGKTGDLEDNISFLKSIFLKEKLFYFVIILLGTSNYDLMLFR
jgi:hypothetical protein